MEPSAALKPIALALGVAVLAGCAATPRQPVDVEAAAEPPSCARVQWAQADDRPLPITDQRIRQSLLEGFAAKGYEVVETGADCLVYHRFTIGAAPRSGTSIGLGVGGGSRRVGGGLGVSFPLGGGRGSNGFLSVDIVDAAANTQAWGAVVEMALAGDNPTGEEIEVGVNRLLFQFPDRGR